MEQVRNKKVYVITGANTGIGFEAALQISQEDSSRHVIIACRDKKRGQEAVDLIKSKNGDSKSCSTVELAILDLNSLASVREFSDRFLERKIPLHCLILNAGVMPLFPKVDRTETVDGFESCFGVNYLGHFYLTLKLLPALEQATHHSINSRVIAVSSLTHRLIDLNWIDFEGMAHQRQGYNNNRAYTTSKFNLALFSAEFNRRFAETLHINSNCMCPGIIPTSIVRDTNQIIQILARLAMRAVGGTVSVGGAKVKYLAVSEEVEGKGGKFFENSKIRSAHQLVEDEPLTVELWNRSVHWLKEAGFGDWDESLVEKGQPRDTITKWNRESLRRNEGGLTESAINHWAVYGPIYIVVIKTVLVSSVVILLFWFLLRQIF